MSTWILIQARTNSTRLPNKAMEEIGGAPMMLHVWNSAKTIHDNVAVLIPYDDPLKKYLQDNNMLCIEGPEKDVLARYYFAAKTLSAQYIVRLTGDCPMIDTAQLFYLISTAMARKLQFITNMPCQDGTEIEVMDINTLAWAHKEAKKEDDREHVTTYIKDNLGVIEKGGGKIAKYKSPYLLEWLEKTSVDTKDDLKRVRKIHEQLSKQGK